MKKSRKDLFNQSNIALAILQMAFPLMLISIINSLYSLADTYFVGQLSESAVGAVSLISPVSAAGSAFSTGLAASATALISRCIGSGDKEKGNHIATSIIEICIILGILIGVLCLVFIHPILHWLDTPQDIYNDTYWYLIGTALDFLFIFVLNIYHAIRQANGDSKTGVIVNCIAGIINIVLDPILIFACHFGLFGAALATTLSKAIVTPFAIYSLLTDEHCSKVDFNKYRMELPLLKEILSVALPSSCGSFLSSFGFILVNKDVVKYGTVAISAYGLAARISNISYIPIYAMGSALTPFIGYYLGANDFERIKKAYKESIKLLVVISIIVIGFGFSTTRMLIGLFIKNASDQLTMIAMESAYYQISTAFFMGWFSNLSGVFNGAGETKITFVISTARLWLIRLPLIWLFNRYTTIGITGVWWAMCLSNLIVSIIAQYWYQTSFLNKIKKKIDTSLATE